MAVLDRLVGLETEYAVRFHPDPGRSDRPANFTLYRAVVAELRKRLPLAAADLWKDGHFLANGAALCFERVRQAADSGLIEGATPECRGPRDVLACQRALDSLLAEAAQDAAVDGQLFLGKSDRDAAGNVYGAQENYELELASGPRLLLWRVGLVLLFPAQLCFWLGIVLLLALLLAYYAVAGLVSVPLLVFTPAEFVRPRLAVLFGRDLLACEETGEPLPAWLEPIMTMALRLVVLPLAFGLWLLARAAAFTRVRRQLLPFLISRAVVSGAGRLINDNEYHIAAKATGLNCVLGMNGILWDRPVYSLGHVVKTMMGWRWAEYRRLYARRQRLQVCIGDSNMAEEAESLKIGTTMLVLDMIEARGLPRPPRFFRPIAALHRIARDPTLTVTVRSVSLRSYTALQLQRFYWKACRDWLKTLDHVPEAAADILDRWENVLDQLEANPDHLFGRLDWITKRQLIDRAGRNLPFAERKKIDLRYHELGPDGYFNRLEPTGTTPRLVSADALDRARRLPPPHSPAVVRSRYIREFADGRTELRVRWNSITLGRGLDAKTIPLPQTTAANQVPLPEE